jgi:hypothetical protein
VAVVSSASMVMEDDLGEAQYNMLMPLFQRALGEVPNTDEYRMLKVCRRAGRTFLSPCLAPPGLLLGGPKHRCLAASFRLYILTPNSPSFFTTMVIITDDNRGGSWSASAY